MKLTDEQIDECYEVAVGTFKRSQSRVRGQQIMPSDAFEWHFARAIEAAVVERCAQVCDAEATVEGVAQKCAAAIRSGE